MVQAESLVKYAIIRFEISNSSVFRDEKFSFSSSVRNLRSENPSESISYYTLSNICMID